MHRAKLEQAEADHQTTILAAVANVNLAKMAVRNAEIELSYCRMNAPIGGRISRLNYHVGNLVGDGQSSLLATIVKIDPIHAMINVSEDDFCTITPSWGSRAMRKRTSANMPMEIGLANEQDIHIMAMSTITTPPWTRERARSECGESFPI